MADKFVQVLRGDGEPGPLYGPYDYAEAERVLYAILKSDKTENGPVEIDDEVREVVDSCGLYSFGTGFGGVYIVESETFGDEDEDEQLRRDEKNGLYGGVEDPAN